MFRCKPSDLFHNCQGLNSVPEKYVISSVIKEHSVSGEISEITIQLHWIESLFGKHHHYLEKNTVFIFICPQCSTC